ncbi:MAG: type I restriction endonuclease subunit R [Acidobacteriota bacterium]
MPAGPEQQARQQIERLLEACAWSIQDFDAVNLGAGLFPCPLPVSYNPALPIESFPM